MKNKDQYIYRDDPEFEEKMVSHITGQLTLVDANISEKDLNKTSATLFKNVIVLSSKEYNKESSLFDYSKKVNRLVNIFKNDGLDKKYYLKACLKQPQLFRQSPETIASNVNNLVDIFENDGLDRKSYLKGCLKQPSLFCQSPETITDNVNNLVNIFKNDGLDRKSYLKACLKQPSLFYQSPETITNNVNNLVNVFKNDGLDKESYLKACLKQPSLLNQSPETIVSNVNNLVNVFKNDDLDKESYLKACLKQPSLFCLLPETIASNVNNLVDTFENDGLDRKTYLKACLKQPQLFCQSPETIANHVKYMVTMVDMGIINKSQESDSPYTYLIDRITANPTRLCFSDKNYIMRLDYGFKTNHPNKNFSIMDKTKGKMETDYQENFGVEFSLDIVSPEVKKELLTRNLWPKTINPI